MQLITDCMCCAVVSESSHITGGQMVSKIRIMTEEEVSCTLVLSLTVYMYASCFLLGILFNSFQVKHKLSFD